MKTKRLKYATLPLLAALALVPSVGFAATNILFEPIGANTLTTVGSGNQSSANNGNGVWQNWYINTAITNFLIEYDAGTPPPTGSAGSVKQIQGWDGSGGASEMTWVTFGGNDFWGGPYLDAAQYESVEMDFKYDTTSTITPTNAAHFEVHMGDNFRASSDGVALTNIDVGAIPAFFDGGWHHVSVKIPSAIANCTSSKGPGFKIFNAGTVTGSFNYWIANIEMVARLVIAPPPTISIEKTSPGLRQFADAPPNYNRQNIRTDTTDNNPSKDIDWVGHPGAKYSWTFSDFPTTPNFQIGFTLTSDPATNIVYSDPDWNSTNAVWLNVVVQGDGSVRARIAFKTNQPAGNGQMNIPPNGTGEGVLGSNSLAAPTAVGTWSLQFVNNTDMILTAPNGASTNLSLPADYVAPFTNISVALYTGMNNEANVGQFATLTRFSATNVAVNFDEDLTDGSISTPFLRLDSQGYNGNLNPPNQIFVTSSDAYWVHWTLPDSGFSLVAKTSLQDTDWSDFAPTTILLNGPTRWVRVPAANLPNPDKSFFALLKRTFTKLQVLLPGETAAPGTPTGKTGTPDPVSLSGGGIITVTVNAVDDTFHLINVSGDLIHLTSTDGTAIMPLDAPLSAGTVSSFVQFGAAGSWTVTATNVSSTQTGTSSSVTVNP